MDNTQRPTPTTNRIGQTPAQQLAAAYLCVAMCDHYMVGIVHPFDEGLWDEAEEILIDEQNELASRVKSAVLYRTRYRRYDLALDVLQRDRDAARSGLDR